MTEDEKKMLRGDGSFWSDHMTDSTISRRLSDELGSMELGGRQTLPASVDWIAAGAVNPIKNQGQCGSCYSFGSTAVVEAALFINGFDLPNLSEQ